jgi:hypothetical protein
MNDSPANLGIYEKQYKKLKLETFKVNENHCRELIATGYYTEAFLALWILTEVIAKNIQITYKASSAAEKISSSLLKKLTSNNIDIEKNNLASQLRDTSFSEAKNIISNKRDYVDAGVVIASLKFFTPELDEIRLKFLLATKVEVAPVETPSKSTVRNRRNDLVHNNSKVSKEDLETYLQYFEYFFSLTIAT